MGNVLTYEVPQGGQGQGELGEYKLAEDVRLELLVPEIVYPEGRVPVAVVEACTVGGLGVKVPVSNGTMALVDVLRALGDNSVQEEVEADAGEGQFVAAGI